MEIQDYITKENIKNLDTNNDGSWDNNGIGAYEYWGAKCYDKGTDYFYYEGGFSFEIPVSVFPKELYREDYTPEDEQDWESNKECFADDLHEIDIPDYIIDLCQPSGGTIKNMPFTVELKDDMYVFASTDEVEVEGDEPDYDY